MSYIDAFVLVIPKKNIKTYKKMAKGGARLWKKHGALEYFECLADDMKVTGMLPFPKLTKAKPSEIVVVAFIVFKSRKHRDQVNKKVFNDPSMSPEEFKDKPMPFDMKRMAYGGFKVMVEA